MINIKFTSWLHRMSNDRVGGGGNNSEVRLYAKNAKLLMRYVNKRHIYKSKVWP
jgi:hypothetical protein